MRARTDSFTPAAARGLWGSLIALYLKALGGGDPLFELAFEPLPAKAAERTVF